MRFLASTLAIVALSNIAAAQPMQRFESVEPHMGTLVRVTLYALDEQSAKDAFRAAFDRINALDEILSDYRPASELNAITRTAVGHPVRVSEDLFAVLSASQRLAEATDGAFDVTEGPVIRLWREARKTRRLPDPAALREAASRGGYRKLHTDANGRTVTLDTADMQLDVGAIGKGYAATAAIQALSRRGIDSALVAVSGDLAFSAAPPGQRGWRIALQPSDAPVPGVPDVLELSNAAVSTSGNSAQHVDVDGRRYSHIIDPASATALVDDLTVTVVARHGADADSLATAVSVLGPERGLALIESRPDTAALITRRTGEDVQVLTSSRFARLASGSADKK
jgi:thiamine biosynthesis lipoprotein